MSAASPENSFERHREGLADMQALEGIHVVAQKALQ